MTGSSLTHSLSLVGLGGREMTTDRGIMLVQTVRRDDGSEGARVLTADPLIRISDSLVNDPPYPHIQSGEGLWVVNADNGTFRYRLLRHYDEGFWSAQRIDKTPLRDEPQLSAPSPLPGGTAPNDSSDKAT